MAANQRDLRKTLREPGQIHWSRFGLFVAAARQPRCAAHLEPGVDINMHIQFRSEPQDRIVIRMTAGDAFFFAAEIFYSDARTVTDPFYDLGAAFVGITRIDGRAPGKAIFVPLQNPQDLRVEWVRFKRLFQSAAD